MTPKQSKALAAMLTNKTQEQAAEAAGVSLTTLKRYMDDPEFQTEYQKAIAALVEDAVTQAKQSLSPAIICLREITEDKRQASTARVQASRALLEYGLRIVELSDVIKRLDALEAADVL